MRRSLLLLSKAATSILLLYFSLRWVNVGVLAERFSRFEPGWAALGFLLLMSQIALLAARWREIAKVCGTMLAFNSAFSWLHSSIRCCHRQLAATPYGSGCWRERAPGGQARLIPYWLIGSSGSLCYRSSLSHACHLRSPSLTTRSRAQFY